MLGRFQRPPLQRRYLTRPIPTHRTPTAATTSKHLQAGREHPQGCKSSSIVHKAPTSIVERKLYTAPESIGHASTRREAGTNSERNLYRPTRIQTQPCRLQYEPGKYSRHRRCGPGQRGQSIRDCENNHFRTILIPPVHCGTNLADRLGAQHEKT